MQDLHAAISEAGPGSYRAVRGTEQVPSGKAGEIAAKAPQQQKREAHARQENFQEPVSQRAFKGAAQILDLPAHQA